MRRIDRRYIDFASWNFIKETATEITTEVGGRGGGGGGEGGGKVLAGFRNRKK